MWSTREALHYEKYYLKKGLTMTVTASFSPRFLFFLQCYLCISYGLFLPNPLQNKWARESQTIWAPSFSISLKSLIPLWISCRADYVMLALWITFILFLFPSMEMLPVFQSSMISVILQDFLFSKVIFY